MFLVVCDAGGLPPEGVVEVGLEAAGLALVEEVFGVAGFAVARELLLVVGPRVEPVAGDTAVAAAGLKKRKSRRLELLRGATVQRSGSEKQCQLSISNHEYSTASLF